MSMSKGDNIILEVTGHEYWITRLAMERSENNRLKRQLAAMKNALQKTREFLTSPALILEWSEEAVRLSGEEEAIINLIDEALAETGKEAE